MNIEELKNVVYRTGYINWLLLCVGIFGYVVPGLFFLHTMSPMLFTFDFMHLMITVIAGLFFSLIALMRMDMRSIHLDIQEIKDNDNRKQK